MREGGKTHLGKEILNLFGQISGKVNEGDELKNLLTYLKKIVSATKKQTKKLDYCFLSPNFFFSDPQSNARTGQENIFFWYW